MYLAADVADCATAITDAAAASATAVAVATTTVQRYSDYKTQPFLYRIIRSMVHILNTARLNLSNNIRWKYFIMWDFLHVLIEIFVWFSFLSTVCECG